MPRAIGAGIPLQVWGRNWDHNIPAANWIARHIENQDLAERYRKARVVLNDHMSDMLTDGFVSNRVYDVLACGSCCVTEKMPGLPDGFAPLLHLYNDEDEMLAKMKGALRDTSDFEERRKFAEHVRASHSFDQRAGAMDAIIAQL